MEYNSHKILKLVDKVTLLLSPVDGWMNTGVSCSKPDEIRYNNEFNDPPWAKQDKHAVYTENKNLKSF